MIGGCCLDLESRRTLAPWVSGPGYTRKRRLWPAEPESRGARGQALSDTEYERQSTEQAIDGGTWNLDIKQTWNERSRVAYPASLLMGLRTLIRTFLSSFQVLGSG